MKLSQLLAEFKKNNFFDQDLLIKGDSLRMLIPRLLKTDEFKGVKEINVVDSPSYLGDEETEKFNPNGKTVIKTSTYKFNSLVQFNSVVNLCFIGLTPKIYDLPSIDKLGEGVWVLPYIIDTNSAPVKQIRVNINIEQLQDFDSAKNHLKKKLIADFERALTSDPNIPGKHGILLRVSPKSIKNIADEETSYVHDNV